ncbi:MAG: sigma factor-like helix-turn-helix DNA-binding protein [Patescibacteria group bacterium]
MSKSTLYQELEGKILNDLFKCLSKREAEILIRRYGLRQDIIGKKKTRQTLQAIGNQYKITRERVRQVENFSIKKIKQADEFHKHYPALKDFVLGVLSRFNGIVEDEFLVDLLVREAGFEPKIVDKESKEIDPQEIVLHQIIDFILSKIINDVVEPVLTVPGFMGAWQEVGVETALAEEGVKTAIAVIEKNNKPMMTDEIISHFKKTPFYTTSKVKITDEMIVSFLHLSIDLKENVFGEWGMRDWGTISLKTVNDRIYYIMSQHKKPLHFSEITDLINKKDAAIFIAHGATVRNILTAESRYILVGRGIYALKEWGVEPGTVSQLIEKIITEAGEPVSRKDIIDKILSQRIIKKQTILITLSNKNKFKKMPEGKYALAEIKK